MREIKEAQRKWRKAKALAGAKVFEQGNTKMAQRLSECAMFTGDETLEEMIALMFSAQGAEFLTTFGFPDLETFRKFTKYQPERFGVYIDCGEIALRGVKNIFVVGNTIASIKCDQTALYRIILMHGASAEIEASGYSVIKIEKDGVSSYNIKVSDNAKVMK